MEDEEETLRRLTQLMRVGVPYDQLERELTLKGTPPEEVTILLTQVKARLRGSPVKRDMGYGDTFIEEGSSYYALPGLSFDISDDVKTKLAPPPSDMREEGDIGEGFLQRLGIDRDVANHWKYNTDPLESDTRYLQFVKLVAVGVPKETIAMKMVREGVDSKLIKKFHQLSAFRKRVPVQSMPTPSSHNQSMNQSRTSRHSSQRSTPANNSTAGGMIYSSQRGQTDARGRHNYSSSSKQRSHSAHAAPKHSASSFFGNNSSLHHDRSGSVHMEKTGFDPLNLSSSSLHQGGETSYTSAYSSRYDQPSFNTSAYSSSHKPPMASSSHTKPAVPSHYGSRSVKATYDYFEYSNAVKKSGEYIPPPLTEPYVSKHVPLQPQPQQSSNYGGGYGSRQPSLERGDERASYGQSTYIPKYGGSDPHHMKTPERKKDKPWSRPTPMSPAPDMYQQQQQPYRGGGLGSSPGREQKPMVYDPDARARLEAAGLSQEVVDTLAFALGLKGDTQSPSQKQRQPHQSHTDDHDKQANAHHHRHPNRVSSSDSVNNKRGKSVDDVARSEADRHRALHEQERDKVDKVWHEFAHRTQGRKSRDEVHQYQDYQPPRFDRDDDDDDDQDDEDDENRQNNRNHQTRQSSSSASNSPHKKSTSQKSQSPSKVHRNMPPPPPRAPSMDRQSDSVSRPLNVEEVISLEQVARAITLLVQENLPASSMQSNEPHRGLKEMMVEAHAKVKMLVNAKKSVEDDLAELQESVTRSSNLLIERAAQQQAEFEGKEEQIRALELRLAEAGDLLEDARQNAGRAASAVAAGEQELLEEAEKMVERQQSYIAELEDQIERLSNENVSEKNMARAEELAVTTENMQLRQKLEECQQALQQSAKNVEEYQLEFETDKVEANHLIQLKEKEIFEMRNENIQLKDSNDKLRMQVTTLLDANNHENEINDEEKNMHNGKVQINNELYESLKAELKSCEDELKKADSHCKKLESSNRELRKELEEVREDHAIQMEEEIAAKDELRKQWVEASQRAEKGLSSLRAEHEKFLSVQNTGLGEAEDAERRLQQENDTLNVELAVARRSLAAVTAEKEALDAKCTSLTKQLERANHNASDDAIAEIKAGWDAERASLQDALNSAKQKYERATQAANQDREACFEARKAAAAAENARLTLEDEHLSARVTIKQLQVSAAQQERTIREMQRRAASSSGSNAVKDTALQREVNNLKEELERTKSENERDGKRIKELEQDLRALSRRDAQNPSVNHHPAVPPSMTTYDDMDQDRDMDEHKKRLFEAQSTDEEKERLLSQVEELESLLDSKTRELRLAQSTISSRNAINKQGGGGEEEINSLKKQLAQSVATTNRLENELGQLRNRLLAKDDELVGSNTAHDIESDVTPLLGHVLAINGKVRELKQSLKEMNDLNSQIDVSMATTNDEDTAEITQQIEEFQLKSTRCMMSYLKSCVIALTKKELTTLARVIDRAYDSRSCANMIKEGYQGVKKVLFRSQKPQKASGSSAAGRNEEWKISPETISSAAFHREMLPSLALMAVGFDNLAPPYHAKIAKSQELNLNMHWIVKIADFIANAKLNRANQVRKPSPSPDPKGFTSGGGSSHDQDRGRARSRGGGSYSGGGARSGSASGARNRSLSVSTRFSMGSNDDADYDDGKY